MLGLALALAATAAPAAGSEVLTQVLPTGARLPGRSLTAREVAALARRPARIRALLAAHPHAAERVFVSTAGRWQVGFYDPRQPSGHREVGVVDIADRSGRVLDVWTGWQVAWPMARGYRGQFGRQATAVWLWVPLLLLFLAPFARPPWRLLHLDLLVLASLSVSLAFFDHAAIGASVPLAYPPLLYLLGRLLWLAWRRGRPGGRAALPPLRLWTSPGVLLGGAMFLLGVRLGMQAFASNVIDVGYAGVIGADHIAHGQALYGHFPPDNPHGDTYGPLDYLSYVPFEARWPWRHRWDDLTAAHVATAVFDGACVGALYVVGRRSRGPRLGLLLAYLWLACPFTLLAANSGANDPLVGALVLAALAVTGAPAARGALLAAAGMVKFAPLGLLPLFAVGAGRRWWRVALGAAAVLAASLALVLALDGQLHTFVDRTLRFQAGRSDSPFSVWGLYGIRGPQRVVQAGAILLAFVVAVLPRRRDEVTLAALSAAVLIAAQLGLDHWFYLYADWFVGPLLVALLARYADPPSAGSSSGSIASARPPAEQRIRTALSQGSSVAAP